MNVLLIYPEFPDTFWSFKHALQFVHKNSSNPPLGLLTIAAMSPSNWNKRLVDMNVTRLTDDDLKWADMVFISAMIIQRESTHEVVKRCKTAGKMVVAGGPLFTGEWQDFPEIDHFVLNEGEITYPQFLKDFENGTLKHIYTTTEYADIRQTPVPMWELLDMKRYDSMCIQFSRGCPFGCEFCNITAMLGHKPRLKSSAQIIAELDKLYELGWRRNVFFVDDNFIGNKKALKDDVLPALINWRKGKVGTNFITEASINLADDPELMKLMTDAGFISVFVGIETPDETSLTECHKSQNKGRSLMDSVKRLQRNGLQVMGGFIVGFDADTPSIFQRQIDFIQNSGIVTAMVGLLQAPFGTPLYERLKAEGRLNMEMSGDNADGTTNIIPKMDMHELKEGYDTILKTIYSAEGFYKRVKTFLTDYQPVSSPVHLEIQEVLALFRTIWKIGILSSDRGYYWNLVFWTLFHEPKKFPLAITFTVYGYHFKRVSELHVLEGAAA
ncbi:B12-binding domain-containing radical SAM protein [Leptolinea tardivitalis]|uniref:Methyltransferase n=1 Tax=Leptolinea tardivitalis TaxID=229920 RepID=A0A0N8GLA1_9CHLR|nr:B12-binding domain-containing radical SAM protein [Leptolinea tardivitalis]KPL71922.1 methyltransferase [Leptolinea tardivitalis]GAP20336.1 Fe-S oxidoreductase [Leptolinea tardivitalis]